MNLEGVFEKFMRSRFQKELSELQQVYRDDPDGFEDRFDDQFDKYFDDYYNNSDTIGWLEQELRDNNLDGVETIMNQLQNDPDYVRERIRLEVYLHITQHTS